MLIIAFIYNGFESPFCWYLQMARYLSNRLISWLTSSNCISSDVLHYTAVSPNIPTCCESVEQLLLCIGWVVFGGHFWIYTTKILSNLSNEFC